MLSSTLLKLFGGTLALSLFGLWAYSVGGDHRENKLRAIWDAERLAVVQKGAEQLAAEVRKANDQAVAQEKRIRDVQSQLDVSDRARDAARDAGERLRVALAAARAGARLCPASSASSAPSDIPTTDAAERVLGDVQRRLDEAQERVAAHADRSRIAGLACERDYDATVE